MSGKDLVKVPFLITTYGELVLPMWSSSILQADKTLPNRKFNSREKIFVPIGKWQKHTCKMQVTALNPNWTFFSCLKKNCLAVTLDVLPTNPSALQWPCRHDFVCSVHRQNSIAESITVFIQTYPLFILFNTWYFIHNSCNRKQFNGMPFKIIHFRHLSLSWLVKFILIFWFRLVFLCSLLYDRIQRHLC